jgi:hypothetical protein
MVHRSERGNQSTAASHPALQVRQNIDVASRVFAPPSPVITRTLRSDACYRCFFQTNGFFRDSMLNLLTAKALDIE